MDILAVREATRWCADYIRSGKVKLDHCLLSIPLLANVIPIGPSSDGTGHISLLWAQYE